MTLLPRSRVIIDTGPLVAMLNRRDAFHDWAKVELAGVASALLTCEAVLTEACFLLRGDARGASAIMTLLRSGLVDVRFRISDEATTVARLLERYRNVPMSFADACLVRMAELHPTAVVMTLDGGFRIYRKSGRHAVPTLMPEGL